MKTIAVVSDATGSGMVIAGIVNVGLFAVLSNKFIKAHFPFLYYKSALKYNFQSAFAIYSKPCPMPNKPYKLIINALI